ncbi:hypothetical protein [Haloechinothrix halophila]|uniref:hypothetical protein n=1 Tax=Haloechinothrix halophila TaxID=1069073 RepID=UPI0012F85BBE|nr:hypothetical protein [Haloechinothrix halophila]
MFTVYCPRHGSEVLLGLSRLRRMVNLESGVILMEFTCYDGEVVGLLTGARVPHEQSVPPADALEDHPVGAAVHHA